MIYISTRYEYLVYANEVDAACYVNPIKCHVDIQGTAVDNGTPSKGWIYNSNILEGQNYGYYNWFISSNSDYSCYVFMAKPNGNLYNTFILSGVAGVRPVVYLSSSVKITDGTGQENNPYKLGL